MMRRVCVYPNVYYVGVVMTGEMVAGLLVSRGLPPVQCI